MEARMNDFPILDLIVLLTIAVAVFWAGWFEGMWRERSKHRRRMENDMAGRK